MLRVEAPSAMLFSAAVTGDPDAVASILDAGANIDERDSDGRTVLHHAAAAGQTLLLQALITRGARCDTQDDGAWSPLHSAASSGRAATPPPS